MSNTIPAGFHFPGYDELPSTLHIPDNIRLQDKQLILLVFYFNPGDVSTPKAREYFSDSNAKISNIINDINYHSKYMIKLFSVMAKDRPTTVECIFPKNTDNFNDDNLNKLFNLENITLNEI